MADTVVTRFAPSPTGYMHIGNLRTALYSYLIAKSQGGKFIVRIEDTDQERLVEGAVDVILSTLAQTGLDYDEGPGVGGDHGPYIQSERKPIYMEYAKQLIESGHAYYCFCTPERLAAIKENDGFGGYDRHCRDLDKATVEANLAAGMPYVIRQKMPLEGTTTYHDEVFGDISMENSQLQDQILIKADGYPTYNFAHVVDDHLMGVTHVVRGSEYLTSTPKYVLLYDAFGWQRPVYCHLPLLMGKDDATPEEIADFYLGLGARCAIVKVGSKGAYFSNGTESGWGTVYPAEKVVDTVGAGDGFAAGFISAMMEGLPLIDCVSRGNAVGSMQVQVRGDNEGLPTREQLSAFMGAEV